MELSQRQKDFAALEIELSNLKTVNGNLKKTMLGAQIERDELVIKKTSIVSNIERLNNQFENMDRESDDLMNNDEVGHICDRFSLSEQVNLLNKIQDNKIKLVKAGFPLHFFASTD